MDLLETPTPAAQSTAQYKHDGTHILYIKINIVMSYEFEMLCRFFYFAQDGSSHAAWGLICGNMSLTVSVLTSTVSGHVTGVGVRVGSDPWQHEPHHVHSHLHSLHCVRRWHSHSQLCRVCGE